MDVGKALVFLIVGVVLALVVGLFLLGQFGTTIVTQHDKMVTAMVAKNYTDSGDAETAKKDFGSSMLSVPGILVILSVLIIFIGGIAIAMLAHKGHGGGGKMF